MTTRIAVTLALLALAAPVARPAGAEDARFSLPVKEDRTFGGRRGALLFFEDRVSFRAASDAEERSWAFEALQQVRLPSSRRIVLQTYEAGGRLHLRAGRSHGFELTQGAIPAELVAFLLARIERPIATAVLPPLPAAPAFEVPVKHEGRHGSEGRLRMFPDGVAYVTDRDGGSRYWRLTDLFSVLRLDRYRLELQAYEDGGDLRRFTFTLKAGMPEGMYDALWQAVNPPAVGRGGVEQPS
jgi:hypothetical protein